MVETGRICGVDYGSKRIGLALSDPGRSIASPLTTIEARGSMADQARSTLQAVADHDVTAWVVGLPLNMDGSEGPQSRTTRAFGKVLAEASGQPVEFWDERLSSLQADVYLAEAELTRKKRRARRDRVAAQVILQTYLDSGSAPGKDSDAGTESGEPAE